MARLKEVAGNTIESIRELLKRNDRAVERAVLRVYERQTAGEQEAHVTVERNGMGFTGFDAELLTSFAKQILENRYGRPEGQRLTPRQMEVARKRMLKYSKQLLEVVAEKQGVTA